MKAEIDELLINVSVDGDSASAEIVFPEGFSGFRGHFPERPILPGVSQISTVMALAKRMTGRCQQIVEIANVKFVSVVTPGQRLQVQCSLANGLLVSAITSDGTRIAELKLRIKDAQE